MPFHMGMKRTARKVPLSTTTAPWNREEMIDGRSFEKTINQSPTLSICHLFSKIKRNIFSWLFYDGNSKRKAKKAADATFLYKKCIVILPGRERYFLRIKSTTRVMTGQCITAKNRAETSALSLISVSVSHSQKRLSSCTLPQLSLRNCTSLRYKYSFYL